MLRFAFMQNHKRHILVILHKCKLQRVDKHNILIENKIYTHKVPTSEIDKFKADCIKESTHGICIYAESQFTLV